MVISAISGGITDLSFHAVGYAWKIVNCFLRAAYSLTLRRVMDVAKQETKSGNLNEFSMVLLNNLLSLPLGLLLIIFFNEWDYLYSSPILRIPVFWVVAFNVLGFALQPVERSCRSFAADADEILSDCTDRFVGSVPTTSPDYQPSLLIIWVLSIMFSLPNLYVKFM